MKTRILITGASGFVGGKITDALLEEGKLDISVLLRRLNEEKAFSGRGVRVYKGDITDLKSLKEPLSGKEIVVHCAALMSNFDYEPKERFYETNVRGTENLLRSSDRVSLKQFLHISTAGVYGATQNGSVREEASYGKTLSVYEWSKKEAELIVLRYAREKGIPFTILRPAQLYGEGMRYGWPQTIECLKKQSMFIPGKGMAKIHLLHIDDFIQALKLAIGNPSAINKIYNIAGPQVLELGEVFAILSRSLGVKNPRHVPYLPVYLASRVFNLISQSLKNRSAGLRLLTPHRVRFFYANHTYDISKVERELGYSPAVRPEEGLNRMAQWLKKESPLNG